MIKENKKQKIVKFYQSYGIVLILVFELLLFSLLSKQFMTLENILNIGRQISFIGIPGVGLTMIILSGGIDISTGTMLALSGVLCTKLNIEAGMPLALSVIITIIVAICCGIASGEVTARLNVPPLITTLAFQTMYKGGAYLLTNAIPIYGMSEEFKFLGQGYLFGIIPFPLLVMIIVYAVGYWFMSGTYIGRHIYAVGGNAEAARLSGINTKRVIVLGFVVCSALTALSGIMMAGRLGSGQPGTGSGFEMDVITAVTLGGVSINGGKGSVLYVAIGALIMGALSNGMMLVGLNEYIQWLVKGFVLIFAVAMSNIDVSE